MRILIVGAGATGGYFGGRLAQAGRDVTFLVRARRAAQLAANGLVIRSPLGDATVPVPATVQAAAIAAPYELVVLSCKAYDLDSAIDAFAPAVGTHTMILPLLNGMRHLDALDARFGRERVLAGQCIIASTLAADGTIMHLNQAHSVTFGERAGGLSERVRAIADALRGARFDSHPSDCALLDMWEKWVVLATLASGTCLMRAAIGDIVAATAGAAVIGGLFNECSGIAESCGFAPRAAFAERALATLTRPDSTLTASMLRDIEAGARIEADHIVGDLLSRRAPRAARDAAPSLLQVAYAHLQAYAARRARTARA